MKLIDVFVRFTCTTFAVTNSAFQTLQEIFHGFVMHYKPFGFLCQICEVQDHFKLHKKILLNSSVCKYVIEFKHNFRVMLVQ
jgi:hypothetical protein